MEGAAPLMVFAFFIAIGAIALGLWLGGVFESKKMLKRVTISMETDGVFLRGAKIEPKESFVVVPDLRDFMPAYDESATGGLPLSESDATRTKEQLYGCGDDVSLLTPTQLEYQMCLDASTYTGMNPEGSVFMGIMHMDHVKPGKDEEIVEEAGFTLGDAGGPLVSTPRTHTYPSCDPHRCRVFVPNVVTNKGGDKKKVKGFVDVFTGQDVTTTIAQVGTAFAKHVLEDDVPEVVEARRDHLLTKFVLKDGPEQNEYQLALKGEAFSDEYKPPESGLVIRPGKHFAGPEVLEAVFLLAVDELKADVISLVVDYEMEEETLAGLLYNTTAFQVNTDLGGTDGVGAATA